MGNEEIAQVQLIPQVLQKPQDLGLDRHIQGRHRLIRDEEPGPLDQRRGDADPLALAAGQLCRPGLQALLRQLHPLQHLPDPAPALFLIVFPVDPQRLLQDPLYTVSRIQGAVRVLKDHLGPLRIVADLPLVRRHHAQDGAGQGGFSRAGLSHQAQDLTVAHIEGHIVQHLLVRPPAEQTAVVIAAGHMAQRQHQLLFHGRSSFLRVGIAAISRLV